VAAIGALVVWLLVSALGSSVSGAIDEEIGRVARDGIWLGLRNSLAALAIGVGGLYALNTLFGRHGDEGWEDWEEYGLEPHDPESREAPPY
jgi:hypothetical protein